ncbi:MAG: GTP-binding protein, partial [Bacteroidales bacterium]|nr:GTP-binding protein [Bacteroidales bacterium]
KHVISSHSFRLPGVFDLEKFSYWMEYFLYINQSVMFRAKGILSFDGNPHKMILQSVRSSYLLEDGDYWEAEEERLNRIVFIGKDLNHLEIREALENLMV